MKVNESQHRGVFLEACLIRHSCAPNCYGMWNSKIGGYTVHALRDIEKNEELTLFLLEFDGPRANRQRSHIDKYGVACECQVCSLPTEENLTNDEKMKEINTLQRFVTRHDNKGPQLWPEKTLHCLDQLAQRCNQFDRRWARLYWEASNVAIVNSDLARWRVFHVRYMRYCINAYGDSKRVDNCRTLLADPSRHPGYCTSTRWKTAINTDPTQLLEGTTGERSLEDWLWRREKPLIPGKLMNFRERKYFPTFADVPMDNALDSDLTDITNSVKQPRRHWCLFGHFLGIGEDDGQTYIKLRDDDGQQFTVASPPVEDQWRQVDPPWTTGEYTVAILYPEKHKFEVEKKDDQKLEFIAINVTDVKRVQIFPISLQKFLELNDRVHQFSEEKDGFRTCWVATCRKKYSSSHFEGELCLKCYMYWLCPDCILLAEDDFGHEADCKRLTKPDMLMLLRLKWDEFRNHATFSLTGS
ncbi:hypothetical protein BT63DRAFT_456883 [Microthyrium microscopicum]|uniref:SET domain-containing protein n=1 Tax=Microthyrium microscopicum TaxID=703497 RepID=A0A6A6U7L1_9PEZI|nr:hypothetical protein BT63DRAFT_456883 [Microthyrium microscopicum]